MTLCIIMTIAGFISGSVMYSYFIPKILLKVDVRRIPGDGNPGGHNAMQAGGRVMGLVCIFLDIAKGLVPVFIAVEIFRMHSLFLVPVVVAPVVGHAFSPFLGFHGGKGVAVSYGVLLGLLPVSCIVILLAAPMIVFRFFISVHPDSLCVIVSIASAFALSLLFEPRIFLKLPLLLIGLIVTFKQIRHPDPGEYFVRIGRYRITYEDFRIRLQKT